MKRVRALTEAERALWAAVAATVKPRVKRQSEQRLPIAEPAAEQVESAFVPAAMPAIPPAKPSLPPLAPVERRLRQRLSRGQREVEAKIDLHGMRQDEAHAALQRFVTGAHARNLSLVLVVTGKGRKVEEHGRFDEAPRGVLNRLVPLWLADPGLRRFVIGFEPASIAHGGSGALYVRIRKAR